MYMNDMSCIYINTYISLTRISFMWHTSYATYDDVIRCYMYTCVICKVVATYTSPPYRYTACTVVNNRGEFFTNDVKINSNLFQHIHRHVEHHQTLCNKNGWNDYSIEIWGGHAVHHQTRDKGMELLWYRDMMCLWKKWDGMIMI